MQAKKFKFPSELHGSANGVMHQYFNIAGSLSSPKLDNLSAPTTNPLPTDAMGSAVSPIGASALSVSSVGPTAPSTSSTAITSPNIPTGPTSSPVTTATSNPLPTGPITSPNLNQPVSTTPVIQVVGTPKLEIKTPNGVTVSTPLGGGFGGGGYGGGAEEEGSKAMATKKKSNLFPWLLIAAGIYVIVKHPLK